MVALKTVQVKLTTNAEVEGENAKINTTEEECYENPSI